MITIRHAHKKDKNFISSSMVKASGGICEHLLSDVIVGVEPDRLLSFEVAKDSSPLSYKNCLIAEDDNASYAGIICAYDAKEFQKQLHNIPQGKRAAVDTFYTADFPLRSFYIDTVYVNERHQKKGIATQLIMHLSAFDLSNYQFLTLYVWEANQAALHLYKKLGFQILETRCSTNTDFPINGKRLLMYCKIKVFETTVNQLIHKGMPLLPSKINSYGMV